MKMSDSHMSELRMLGEELVSQGKRILGMCAAEEVDEPDDGPEEESSEDLAPAKSSASKKAMLKVMIRGKK